MTGDEREEATCFAGDGERSGDREPTQGCGAEGRDKAQGTKAEDRGCMTVRQRVLGIVDVEVDRTIRGFEHTGGGKGGQCGAGHGRSNLSFGECRAHSTVVKTNRKTPGVLG